MFKRQTPEEAAAQRAYKARYRSIQSGEIPGLMEKESRALRPEIRNLIDEALAKRDEARADARDQDG